jgi:hypothetical protein
MTRTAAAASTTRTVLTSVDVTRSYSLGERTESRRLRRMEPGRKYVVGATSPGTASPGDVPLLDWPRGLFEFDTTEVSRRLLWFELVENLVFVFVKLPMPARADDAQHFRFAVDGEWLEPHSGVIYVQRQLDLLAKPSATIVIEGTDDALGARRITLELSRGGTDETVATPVVTAYSLHAAVDRLGDQWWEQAGRLARARLAAAGILAAAEAERRTSADPVRDVHERLKEQFGGGAKDAVKEFVNSFYEDRDADWHRDLRLARIAEYFRTDAAPATRANDGTRGYKRDSKATLEFARLAVQLHAVGFADLDDCRRILGVDS